MKLLTKEILSKLKSNPRDDNNNKPWLKLFNPCGSQTWLLSEIEEDGDTLFGLCDLGMGSPELGYVSMAELRSIKFPPFGLPIERDLHWEAEKSIYNYAQESRHLGYINT